MARLLARSPSVLLALGLWFLGCPASLAKGDDSNALNQQVSRLLEQGKYQEALPIAERAVEVAKRSRGPAHHETADALNNLGLLFKKIGNYGKAESLYQEALQIYEKVLGPKHPDTATGLNNLAQLYLDMGEYAKAEPLHQQALRIRQKVLGPDSPDTAQSLNNLGELYQDTREYGKAEPLYQEALRIYQRVPGPESPETATSLNNLASLYLDMGEYAKAEPLYREALRIYQKVLGPENSETAASLNSLAHLAFLYDNRGLSKQAKGDSDGAIADSSKAIELKPDFAEAYDHRGVAKRTKGDSDGAIADDSKAIELKPDFAEAYDHRGVARRTKGDSDGAIADDSKAIELKPDFAEAYDHRGVAKGAKGDSDGAIADDSKAIELKPDFTEAYDHRGVAKGTKGDSDGAIADDSKAIELKPDFAEAYNHRGVARQAKGDSDGAIADYNKAITLKPDFAEAYNNRRAAAVAKPTSTSVPLPVTTLTSRRLNADRGPFQPFYLLLRVGCVAGVVFLVYAAGRRIVDAADLRAAKKSATSSESTYQPPPAVYHDPEQFQPAYELWNRNHGLLTIQGGQRLAAPEAKVNAGTGDETFPTSQYTYQPPILQQSILDLSLSPFSAVRRLKRRLCAAVLKPSDYKTVKDLKETIDCIDPNAKRSKQRRHANDLAKAAIAHLCYCFLKTNSPDLATYTLSKLVMRYPDSEQILALRVDLLASRVRQGVYVETLLTELLSIISDKRANSTYSHPCILGALGLIYLRAGSTVCLNVITSASKAFQQIPAVKSVTALCSCPGIFGTLDEAESWSKQVLLNGFAYSKRMRHDALLLHARVAEWRNEPDTMRKHASEAASLSEPNSDANYWLARSYLHGAASSEELVVKEAARPNMPKWKRLLLEVDLHQNPNLTSANAALAVLNEDYETPDARERLLLLRLASIALEPSLGRTNADLAACAKLCAQYRTLSQSPLGWATANIALDLLINDANYDRAWDEMAALRDPTAFEISLAEIAAILANRQLTEPGSSRFQPVRAIRTVLSFFLRASKSDGAEIPRFDHLQQLLADAVGDPFTVYVPGLKRCIEGLSCLLSMEVSGHTSGIKLIEMITDSISPKWLRWLALRVMLLHSPDSTGVLRALSAIASSSARTATCLMWIGSYATPPTARMIIQWFKDHSAHALSPSLLGFVQGMFPTSTAACLETLPSPFGKALKSELDIGDDVSSVIVGDFYVNTLLLLARAALSKGAVQSALTQLQQVQSHLRNQPAILRVWWDPVVGYWLAVVKAHGGDHAEAFAGFKALLTGTKALEALGQLALLAIQAADLPGAETFLAHADSNFPGVFYANALLSARRGNFIETQRLLGTFDDRFAGIRTVYRQACLRLAATIQEQAGRDRKAESLLRYVIRIDPTDRIASLRLLRLILRRAYGICTAAGKTSPLAVLRKNRLHRLVQNINAFANSAPYTQLFALFTESSETFQIEPVLLQLLKAKADSQFLQQLFAEPIPEVQTISSYNRLSEILQIQSAAFRQFLIRRLMDERHFEGAVAVAQKGGPPLGDPSNLIRTDYILLGWHFLRNAYAVAREDMPTRRPFPQAEDAQKAISMERLRTSLLQLHEQGLRHCKESDPSVDYIRAATSLGMDLCSGYRPKADCPKSPPRIAMIEKLASVFIADSKRSSAGIFLDFLNDTRDSLTDPQRQMLGIFHAWYGMDDTGCLEAFTALETHAYLLPVNPEDFWLGKSLLLYRRNSFAAIVESKMPLAIAEMSDSNGRILITLAYARLAAQMTRNGDVRGALQKVRTALSALSSVS